MDETQVTEDPNLQEEVQTGEEETEDGGLVGVKPQQGLFNLLDPELVIPGQPEKSMIYHRMTLDGLGRMPHIASNVKNSKAVDLIREWIGKMDENEYHKQTGIDTTEE